MTDQVLKPNDPVAQAIADAIREQSGKPVAKKFGIDGEVLLIQVNKQLVEIPLEVDELGPLPNGFGEAHKDAMGAVYTAIHQIKAMGTRSVPLTRKELLSFNVDRRAVDQLERWEFLKMRVVKFDKKNGKKQPAMAVYYFTPKGRAYVREHFDETYGLPGGSPVSQGATPGGEGPAPSGGGGLQPPP